MPPSDDCGFLVPCRRPPPLPSAPCGALISGPADGPAGVPQTETFLDSPLRGTSQYLVSTVPANTKYSVNRQFIPVRHFSFSAPHAHAKPKAGERPESRDEPLKTRKIWKLITGPDFFRPRPKQRRMTHKRRLVLRRQGFVFVTFVTPICCVSVMWITGDSDAADPHLCSSRRPTPARWRERLPCQARCRAAPCLDHRD